MGAPITQGALDLRLRPEGAIGGLIGAAELVPVDASYGESIVKTLEIPEADAASFLAVLVKRTSGRVAIEE